jgi:hypothetical protein
VGTFASFSKVTAANACKPSNDSKLASRRGLSDPEAMANVLQKEIDGQEVLIFKNNSPFSQLFKTEKSDQAG